MRGVSTSEIGYLVKANVDELSNLPGMTIQLYDTLSGGAGFASSAVEGINELLRKMSDELICSDNCEEACSACLLDSNTRHDANSLNRNAALDWLGDDFNLFLNLPSEYQYLPDAQYCYHSIKEKISSRVSKGANRAAIWLSSNPNEWDLNARQVHRYVEQLVEYNNISLSFVLTPTNLSTSIQQILKRYSELGVELVTSSSITGNSGYLAVAIGNDEEMHGIAVQNESLLVPGSNWLDVSSDCMVVSALLPNLPTFTPLDTLDWSRFKSGERIEVREELNGCVDEFGEKLWRLIEEKYPTISQKITHAGVESIDYTDRYIQSPWSILLLGEVMRGLGNLNETSFSINTLFNQKDRTGRQLHHDWDCKNEFKQVVDVWFEKGISLPVDLTIHQDRRNVPHRRELILTFKDGERYSIAFDQGVGYWSHDVSWDLSRFEFTEVNRQLEQMIDVWSSGSVKNSADWPSVLYINKL
jgi:hypothetical protein